MDLTKVAEAAERLIAALTPSAFAVIAFIRAFTDEQVAELTSEAADVMLTEALTRREITPEAVTNARVFVAKVQDITSEANIMLGLISEKSAAALLKAARIEELNALLAALPQPEPEPKAGKKSQTMDKRRAFAMWAGASAGKTRGPIAAAITEWYSFWNPNGETTGWDSRFDASKREEIRADARKRGISLDI